jgi:hypothetical protein
MADDVVLPGTGDICAADEIAGKKHQRVKVQHGADGSATDVSSASPMPVADGALAALLADPASETTLAAVLAALGGTIAVDDADTQTALATIVGHVDGLEALLTTIDADTGAIKTAVETLDNAISGSEMQVDVVAALPAGANNIGQVDPRGNIAHDGVDSGNPVKVGGKARTALVAVSAASDRTDLSTDKFGRLFAVAAPLDVKVSGTATMADDSADTVISAPGASIAVVVTDILVVNGDDETGTKVSIRSATTVKLSGYAGVEGGGFQLSNPDGLFVCGTNEAVTAICATTGADVDVFVSGYKIPA